MASVKSRIAKLEAAMNPPSPPEVEWVLTTPDMTDEEVAGAFRENLRLSNEHYRKYPEHYEVKTNLTDEEAAESYRVFVKIMESFPRTTQLTSQ